jgi:hypothetical protein
MVVRFFPPGWEARLDGRQDACHHPAPPFPKGQYPACVPVVMLPF